MLVSKLGEFGLINRIKRAVRTDPTVVKGIGDDCAVLKFTQDKYLLFTCDMLVEGVDFTPKDNPYFIGRKALAVSISDIAACGGVPHYALASLGIPKDTTVNTIDKITKGISDLANKYGINIVGGDISRARQITLDVSMLGFVEKKNLVLRSQAKRGDVIFVTGALGGTLAHKHHLKFTPRLKEAHFLVNNFKINSMIDISDGLAQDLGHILEESSVGAILYEDLIPVSKYARNLHEALYAGEDFELVFTLSRNAAAKLMRLKRKHIFRPIGEIVDKKYRLRLVDKKGREKIIKPAGFKHF